MGKKMPSQGLNSSRLRHSGCTPSNPAGPTRRNKTLKNQVIENKEVVEVAENTAENDKVEKKENFFVGKNADNFEYLLW